MSKKEIKKFYISEEQYRRRLYAMGRKDAYTMPAADVYRFFERGVDNGSYKPAPIKTIKPKNPQTTLEDFGKAGHAAFNPINTRTVSACKRYYEAGIAGQECKMVLQQAQQYEQMVGRDIYGIDAEKISIYSVLPRVIFGMTERNIIYIKNWYALTDQDRQILAPFFDYRGVAYPGKSGQFIKDNLPKGRQEKRMFETFNIVHGLNIEITPEGYIYIPELQEADTYVKDLLEFYFTPEGYAKTYFQNGFMSRLGLRFREHIPSKIKTREQLLRVFERMKEKQFTGQEAEEYLKVKNPSMKTNLSKFDDRLATDIVNRYRLYTKLSSFLNEDLTFIGSTSYADEVFNLTEEFDEKSDVIATTFYNKEKFGLSIADSYAYNVNKLAWALNNASTHKWIPEGCNSLDYITAHEFSHGLIHVYDLSRDPVLREIEERVHKKGHIVKDLSLNAKMNTKEFIADGWCEFVLSEHPREISTAVGERVLKFLQKKVIIL